MDVPSVGICTIPDDATRRANDTAQYQDEHEHDNVMVDRDIDGAHFRGGADFVHHDFRIVACVENDAVNPLSVEEDPSKLVGRDCG